MPRISWAARVVTILAALLVVKVAINIVLEYRHYFPPNFDSDFLRGRESYFWNGYHAAFFVHLVAGPASLLLGMLLIGERFRNFAPAWHRRLGRVQAIFVLLLLTPSGLWMSYYAESGNVAAAGLASLSVATAASFALGWKAAIERRFADHRLWMLRVFALLCSAVVIRLIGGFVETAGIEAAWLYPAACWVSWLMPIAIFELARYLDLGRLFDARTLTRTG